jgi:hypothetical protein
VASSESVNAWTDIDAFGRQVRIAVAHGDALSADVDALALKYAQAPHGVDREALRRIASVRGDTPMPGTTDYVSLGTSGHIAARTLLLVGTVDLQHFEYAEIRDVSRRAVLAVRNVTPTVRHLGMTLHGADLGLDEREAFIAQLAGMLDALRRGEWPASLETITLYELDPRRAKRLGDVLLANLPRKVAEQSLRSVQTLQFPPPIESAGLGSKSKPHVFVAMQFGKDTEDLFHYGIQRAVHANGLLCERIDKLSFTGEIIAQVKERISAAALVIAELSSANPNVYLEVGYAWGRGVQTVLLTHDIAQLRFDVHGHRCLIYSSIMELEKLLTEEIRALGLANYRH